MTKQTLEQILNDSLPQVRQIVEASNALNLPFLRWPYAALAGPRKRVEEWLVLAPDYIPAQMITDAGGTFIFDAGPASQALLALSVKFGPAEAAAWYQSLSVGKRTTGLRVSLVQGVVASQPITLVGGVSLVPFGAITPSVMTADAGRFVLPEHQIAFGPKPTLSQLSAVVEAFEFDQKLVPNGTSPNIPPPSLLGPVLDGLTLVGPSSVRPVRQWGQTTDPMFEFIRGGSAFGQPFSELAWLYGSPVASLTESSAQLVKSYVDLASKEPRISVAAQRLNAALRRLSPRDKAIEIGTALESALVSEKGPEVTYRLALRAARLLGGSMAERVEIRSLMTAFYAVRSDAVHAGVLKPKYKTKTPQELTEWAQAKLVECLRNFVEGGQIPPWDEIELT